MLINLMSHLHEAIFLLGKTFNRSKSIPLFVRDSDITLSNSIFIRSKRSRTNSASLKTAFPRLIIVLRCGAAEIYRACRSIKPTVSNSRPALNQTVTSPRFTNEQLSRIAALTSKIACECPNHLAELIINLTAFEKYSSECANRNEEDAQLHFQLNQSAGASRLILEESLIRLMEIEGIEV